MIIDPIIAANKRILITSNGKINPPSPGLKYTHYSPNAYIILIEQEILELEGTLKTLYQKFGSQKKKIGLIHTHSQLEIPKIMIEDPRLLLIDLSNFELSFNDQDVNSKKVAHGLFDALRKMDLNKIEIVFVEGIAESLEGLAVMNRLRKAASEIIISRPKKP